MSKRTALLILLVIALAIVLVAYQRHRTYTHFNGGEVTAADRVASAPVEAASTPAAAKPPAGQPLESAPTGTAPQAESTDTTDSLPADPPEHATFSGSGRFQVYRQGNLTWRLDTANGSTCVLFATDDEWRKPRVYDRACTGE